MYPIRTIFIYTALISSLFSISLYSMYLFGIKTDLIFSNTALLFPFIQKLELPLSLWTLPQHILLFPDAILYVLLSFASLSQKQTLVLYNISSTLCFYVLLCFSFRRYNKEHAPILYCILWITILLIYFNISPFFIYIFMPNGILGFLTLYTVVHLTIYTALVKRNAKLHFIFLSIILIILSWMSPLLTCLLITLPILILSFLQRRLHYPTEQHLYMDIMTTIATSLGYLLHIYYLPNAIQPFSIMSHVPLIDIIMGIPLALLLLFFLGFFYIVACSLIRKDSFIIYLMRMLVLGFFTILIALSINIIEPAFALLILLTTTLLYATPYCLSFILSFLTIRKQYLFTIALLLSSFFTFATLYWSIAIKPTPLPAEALVHYLDTELEQNKTYYILAPRDIAPEITLFSKAHIRAIPYIPDTLQYSSFIPDDAIQSLYSAIIIQKDTEHSLLIKQLLSLIGEPQYSTTIGNYIIMQYGQGFHMPNAGQLATYTTPLGNIIRNSLNKAPSIPLPHNISIPVKDIKIIHEERKYFLALIFDQKTPFPMDTSLIAYTLSPSSSALRKLASGIRREFPFLSPILPLEDKNKIAIHSKKDIYMLENGDFVIPINITSNVSQSLTFLSLATEHTKPSIIFQYPTPPFQLP